MIDSNLVEKLGTGRFLDGGRNVIFRGPPGMIGKLLLASARGYKAWPRRYSVLFITAVVALNNLVAAHAAQRLKAEFKKHLSPQLIVID